MKEKRKEIIRDQKIQIKLSNEEKEALQAFANSLDISPARLARNIIMTQVSKKIENTALMPFYKAYRHYLKVTKQDENLKID